VEILNQVILAGNLTDQPSVSDAGSRQFVRARLAQNWFYDT
jgi:single-stranded DNA-binding protein